ncbi:hypothetical protein MLD38_001057 [Melastoma candidum]|nr:hypothetical protein MLD38_001057 [Melastoma candidum]
MVIPPSIAPHPPSASSSDRICHPRRAKSTKGKCLRFGGGVAAVPSVCHTSAHPLEHCETEVSEPDTGRTLQLMITDPSAGESSGSVKASEGDPDPLATNTAAVIVVSWSRELG